MVDNIVTQVDQHWRDNNLLLGETKQKVTTSVALKQFYDQLATLQQIVDGYERFICNEGRVSDEAMEIFRQLEQCRVSWPTHWAAESSSDLSVLERFAA